MIDTDRKTATGPVSNARGRRVGSWIGALGGLLSAAAPSIAKADDVAARNLAEQMFSDGKRLMAEGKFDEACPKLAESQRLDPGGGTILNLAVCHQGQGHFASAWSEFREALAVARTEARHDREELALQHLAQVEPKVSHLKLLVDPKADVPGLTVKLDGQAFGRAAWNSPLPVDAGVHEVSVSAPGKVDRVVTVQGIGVADSKSVTILALDDAPAVPDSALHAESSQEPRASDPLRGKRAAGFVVGGIGLAALGAGSVFGVEALQNRRDSDASCSGSICRTQGGVDLNNDAQRFANYANVGIGVGIVGLAIGTYLVLTSSPPKPVAASTALGVKVVPAVRVGSSGLGLSGTW
jgi:hypothetical protein